MHRPRPGRCLRTNATFRFIEVNGGGTCASSSRGPWAAKDKQTLAQDGDAGGGTQLFAYDLAIQSFDQTANAWGTKLARMLSAEFGITNVPIRSDADLSEGLTL